MQILDAEKYKKRTSLILKGTSLLKIPRESVEMHYVKSCMLFIL